MEKTQQANTGTHSDAAQQPTHAKQASEVVVSKYRAGVWKEFIYKTPHKARNRFKSLKETIIIYWHVITTHAAFFIAKITGGFSFRTFMRRNILHPIAWTGFHAIVYLGALVCAIFYAIYAIPRFPDYVRTLARTKKSTTIKFERSIS